VCSFVRRLGGIIIDLRRSTIGRGGRRFIGDKCAIWDEDLAGEGGMM